MKCPICLGRNEGECTSQPQNFGHDAEIFNCTACGIFEIARSALVTYLSQKNNVLTDIQRAVLSHIVCKAQTYDFRPIFITTHWLESFALKARLPSPIEQAKNLIRTIGDYVLEHGKEYVLCEPRAVALTGAASISLFEGLLKSLLRNGDIYDAGPAFDEEHDQYATYNLTLKGWERYEQEKRGELSGRYGFMAMQFDDPDLQPLFKDVIKPKVKEATGYDVVEVREKSRAGVIDNIIREEIRNAAFVLADLSHGNNGAYWEAGYAEGLGKPVIYLCEQKTFDETKTHFDTNHCTTVMWSKGEEGLFAEQLIATIQRSLITH